MPPQPQIISLSDTQTTAPLLTSLLLNPTDLTTLSTAAAQAKTTAYAPYSNFRVGAAFLTAEGTIVPGANVENASYPVGTCAERVALGRAVTEGHRSGFRAVGVSTDLGGVPASPCGMCRQFMREFVPLDCPIFMFNKDDEFVVMKLEELLPLSFGPENLPPPGQAGPK